MSKENNPYSPEILFKMFAELREQQAETDRRFKKTDKFLSSLSEKFAETDKQIQETDKQIQETAEQMKETDRLVKELSKNIQGINRSIGEETEMFFYTSLQRKPVLGEIKFDYVDKNLCRTKGNESFQIDIFLENGESVGLVEVKNKVTRKSFEQLSQQIEKFPKFYSVFKNYKIYGAIAGKIFPQHLQQEALQKGYFVLLQQGDHVEVVSPV